MTGRDRVGDYLDELHVPRGTLQRLDVYVFALVEEAAQQNLVSSATLADVWDRHVLDSLQLLPHARQDGSWADIGSGAGLPGLVIAAAEQHHVTLIEPRAKRADFLRRVAARMNVDVEVHLGRAEALTGSFDTISARAVAPLDRLLAISGHLAHQTTRFVFPKGRTARSELDAALRSWQGRIDMVQSITDPDASIIVAEEVRPRKSK